MHRHIKVCWFPRLGSVFCPHLSQVAHPRGQPLWTGLRPHVAASLPGARPSLRACALGARPEETLGEGGEPRGGEVLAC